MYHLNLGPAETVDAVEHHLEQCPHCRTELEVLSDYLDLEPTPSPPEPQALKPRTRLGDLLAVFVSQPLQPALRGGSQMARPVLASTSGDMLMFEATGITVFLELQAEDEGPQLKGQLVAEPEQQAGWSGALVDVWQDDQLQIVATVDDMGVFSCYPLQPGEIDLRIKAADGSVVVIEDIELRE
ncbi:MAG: hypothetical protein GYB65_12765 [Chloroflexi bacterium]|nr:hypothetical protein [Chloroflexota bacterium]